MKDGGITYNVCPVTGCVEVITSIKDLIDQEKSEHRLTVRGSERPLAYPYAQHTESPIEWVGNL